jgi:hypothetical protein
MPTPSTRTPVKIARGTYSNLNSSLSDIQDGEILYAEDQNKLYIKEGSALVVLTQPAANAVFTGDTTFNASKIVFDDSSSSLEFADNVYLWIGSGNDIELWHDGTDSNIKSNTGQLKIRGSDIRFKSGNDGETFATFFDDGACTLYFNNLAKIATTVTGIDVTGTAVTDGLTVAGDSDFTGKLKEAVVITAGKLSATPNLDLASGNVFLFTTAESTTSTPNLRYNGSTTLASKMSVGDCLTVTIITTANASGYSAQLTIDGGAVTENWIGGSAPSAGGSSGKDILAYTIIKTGTSGTVNNDFTVLANFIKTS